MTTLEKIKAELHATAEMHNDGDYYLRDKWVDEIIDKYAELQPCDDAVSRRAVLDINESHHGQMPNHINYQIWQEIKELPSVRPQEQTGHWIEGEVWEDTDGGWGRWQKCSVCRQSKHHKTYFCPDCGAKMVQPQERSE